LSCRRLLVLHSCRVCELQEGCNGSGNLVHAYEDGIIVAHRMFSGVKTLPRSIRVHGSIGRVVSSPSSMTRNRIEVQCLWRCTLIRRPAQHTGRLKASSAYGHVGKELVVHELGPRSMRRRRAFSFSCHTITRHTRYAAVVRLHTKHINKLSHITHYYYTVSPAPPPRQFHHASVSLEQAHRFGHQHECSPSKVCKLLARSRILRGKHHNLR
jgi:hypothetical protein